MRPKRNLSENAKLRNEKAQLLAEEKWILDALAKIRHQRNCLQVERLHLLSLQEQLKKGNDAGKGASASADDGAPSSSASQQGDQPSSSSGSRIEPTAQVETEVKKEANKECKKEAKTECKEEPEDFDSDSCNKEELDLAVPACASGVKQEPEEEFEDDNVVMDVTVDINDKLGLYSPSEAQEEE